tara:strand:+ start:5623 stop:6018 length:396 start_codon:yes stop_codon:yes gene_type:complete
MSVVTNYKRDKFDIDLEYGQKFEKHLDEVFKDGRRIEVKTERNIWKDTGNIGIEIRCRGVESGLSITEAEYWIHLLADGDTIKGGFIMPVNQLKKRVKELFKEGLAKIVMGGDDNASQLVLIPIKELLNIK